MNKAEVLMTEGVSLGTSGKSESRKKLSCFHFVIKIVLQKHCTLAWTYVEVTCSIYQRHTRHSMTKMSFFFKVIFYPPVLMSYSY